MIELRTAIQKFISDIHERTSHEDSTFDEVFPYITYSLNSVSSKDENQELFVLEVDGWDKSDDSTTIEALMELIDGDGELVQPTGLNKAVLTTSKIIAIVTRDLRYTVPDSQKAIKHKRYVYSISLYEGSN